MTVRDVAASRLSDLDIDGGAEVVRVSGIAEEAGLQAGDVVLRMKGRIIDSADTLRDVADDAEAGDVIPVLVLRQREAWPDARMLPYACRTRADLCRGQPGLLAACKRFLAKN